MSPSISESGDYPITFVIVDTSGTQRTASIVLKVQESLISEDDLNDPDFNNTENDNIIRDPTLTSPDLEAKIKIIYNDGQVKIMFNREIIVPTDFSSFNDKVMLLKIESSRGLANFTWNITSIE